MTGEVHNKREKQRGCFCSFPSGRKSNGWFDYKDVFENTATPCNEVIKTYKYIKCKQCFFFLFTWMCDMLLWRAVFCCESLHASLQWDSVLFWVSLFSTALGSHCGWKNVFGRCHLSGASCPLQHSHTFKEALGDASCHLWESVQLQGCWCGTNRSAACRWRNMQLWTAVVCVRFAWCWMKVSQHQEHTSKPSVATVAQVLYFFHDSCTDFTVSWSTC